LILVTSKWVKKIYVRDGLKGENIKVLAVGCDTDSFIPRDKNDPKVASVREALGVAPDQIMILTVGGDATSKGAQEVMQALAVIDTKAPDWKYVCKVWPQPRTEQQNLMDLQLATQLGIEKNVVYSTNVVSRNFMYRNQGNGDAGYDGSRTECVFGGGGAGGEAERDNA
jgi:glycosyltransferase involved in cell wall biosynthesis